MKKAIIQTLLFAVIILVSGEILFEHQVDIGIADVGIALLFGGLAAVVQQNLMPSATQQENN